MDDLAELRAALGLSPCSWPAEPTERRLEPDPGWPDGLDLHSGASGWDRPYLAPPMTAAERSAARRIFSDHPTPSGPRMLPADDHSSRAPGHHPWPDG